ncbi:hypothetical protein BCR35DRAFT_349411 [Leucosporidium creatinivorum]|uniref:Uncharacterized protein n=1 Tax=Leucosporidium creatinivorum TaxID=106004 RepID=A0A1Y2G2L5_9BASI|nr:hypothetical protein BCR35DRAFT_349411 [Leucosporidium creatinivorum]
MAYMTGPNELTVLQALTQGRQALLNDAFPLFSTSFRSKSAPQAPLQPPHTLSRLTTSTISIGPHSFSDTKFFVADWTEGATRKRKLVAVAPPAPPPASPGKMTPSLISRLNADSAKDPQLATILRKAATGQASPQELAHLAKHIKSVEKEDAEQVPLASPINAAASTSQQWEEVDEPPAPPSLILEFRESSTKQFVMPPHYTYTELPPSDPTAKPTPSDVLLSCFVFPSASGKGKERAGFVADGTVPVPIDLVVKDCSEEVKDALLRCSRTGRARDLAVEDWWKRMILSVVPRIHIIDPPPAPPVPPELAPASSIPMLSRTASFSTADAPNANGKRPALDSGSATPTSRPKAKKKAPARRSNARATSTTAEITPAPSSAGASPKPETGSRPRSNARPARKNRATSKKAKTEMESQGDGAEGVDPESLG